MEFKTAVSAILEKLTGTGDLHVSTQEAEIGHLNPALSEPYLCGVGAGCGGAESVQQAQAALCVCVGNLAA